jgi:hypothetical protein
MYCVVMFAETLSSFFRRRQWRESQAFEPMVSMLGESLRDTIKSEDRVPLLRGIASLANHFLGDHDPM